MIFILKGRNQLVVLMTEGGGLSLCVAETPMPQMGKMRRNGEVVGLVKVGRNREAVQFVESVHVRETE